MVHSVNRPSLVENIAKKNHSHFPIAVLLTTLICRKEKGGQKNRNGKTTAVLFGNVFY
jgi:hypothetical protein